MPVLALARPDSSRAGTQGEPPARIQSLSDDETSGTMSFRRVVGRWRLQDRS
jgi:hypothetical protein